MRWDDFKAALSISAADHLSDKTKATQSPR